MGIDRIFEGDPAPTQPFEDLIHFKTNNAIGKVGTERLLPWLKKNSSTEYIICISDPRERSTELRRAMKTIPNKFRGEKILFINADSPAESRRLVQKIFLTYSFDIIIIFSIYTKYNLIIQYSVTKQFMIIRFEQICEKKRD